MTGSPGTDRFLGAIDTTSPAAILLGAPLDVTESFRPGTGEAPTRIRQVSDVLETYSPEVDRDLGDLPLADWGDLVCAPGQVEEPLALLADTCERASRQGLPLIVGGEHTATVGSVRGIQRVYPDLYLLQVDAHLDLRDSYDGRELSHATVIRRIADEMGLDHVAQYGIRSGTRDEFGLAQQCLESRRALELSPFVRDRMAGYPIYLTIDIDVLDPSCAPGTGCPEPGGATFRELLRFVYSLRDLRVVAADVMEVLPAVDINDITSVAAAKLIRELALLFGRRGPGGVPQLER